MESKIIKGWAVTERGKIICPLDFWIYKKKGDAERMMWSKGERYKNRRIVPCEIKLN